MTNVLLEIQYDGTRFSGWQRQLNARTVQGEIEKVLSTLCLQKIDVQGTSRTDAGVHAYMQGVSFKGDFAIPVNRIKRQPMVYSRMISISEKRLKLMRTFMLDFLQ